jgi:hypothetical protein
VTKRKSKPVSRPSIESLLANTDVAAIAAELRAAERASEAAKATKAALDRKYGEACRELHTLQTQIDDVEQAAARKFSHRKILKAKKGRSPSTIILALCDWHAEENIDPAVVNGQNQFDLDVCRRRVSNTFSKFLLMLDFVRGYTDVTECLVWLGGDLINGYIHEEMEESNNLTPVEAQQFIMDLVCPGLESIQREGGFPSVGVVTNVGNHGRTTRRKRVATGYGTNWEQSAYLTMERVYRQDPRFAFKIERGTHNLVDIQGHAVRFHHGDAIRYQGGVGGLTIPMHKAISQWNKSLRPAKYDIFGHWHQYMDMWHFTSCGCLVGYNAYAIEIKAEYQPPTQTFIVINKDRGKILAEKIFCEEPVR